ncbi:hypothetical protein JX265_006842 [Neoarthrinium moseri]|uniref:Uncharacterized protein n=1 Tax=Neoarthrinium moseri TaxID=1658444 RepID=A0A9P9WL30_9PEZI|nr:hypothetical protein JX265_006842 [Neoarthrinium moseri]
MVSSSQASTASADVSDDDAGLKRDISLTQPEIGRLQGEGANQHEKHNRLEATVKWTDNGRCQEQAGLMFDLQYHAAYNTAFFKLRASVTMKNSPSPDQVSLFIFLAPEVIQTLSLSSDHPQDLGPDTVRLHFQLRDGQAATPTLVVPNSINPSHVAWKNKQSSSIWDSLRSLARATDFDVLCRLPRRVMSEARLQSLCEALSSHGVVSTPGFANLGGLYGGRGGKVVTDEVEVEAAVQPSDESPPAYQDLEPGPPMPPIVQGKSSNKRRRGNSDIDGQRILEKPREDLESTVAWLVTELKDHKAREAVMAAELQEYKLREAMLVTELKRVNEKVAKLTSQQEQHEAKCKALDDDMHDRIGAVEARLYELDEDLDLRVDSRLDETLDLKSDSIREELVDYIDENLPNRIQGVLEEATFSARF